MPKTLLEILKSKFNISSDDIDTALALKTEKGGTIGDILMRKKIITENQLLEALSIQHEMPFWPELPLENLGNSFTQHVPIQFLKKSIMVPLEGAQSPLPGDVRNHVSGPDSREELYPGEFVIAVNNPALFQPIDDLARILGIRNCKSVLSTKQSILSAINIAYDLSRDSAQQLVQDMEEDGTTIISDMDGTADLLDDTSDAPVIKLVNHIISQSVKARASDIHFEPYQNSFKVRYRVDGILYDLLTPPKWIQASLISRIKVMAKMNIAEKTPAPGRSSGC